MGHNRTVELLEAALGEINRGSRVTGDENWQERRAADAVGFALGRELRRYECEPGGDDSLDYIDGHDEVYEMKRVTSEEFVELRKRQHPRLDSTQLRMRWSVLLRAPTMDDKFRPMPDFPSDDPALIASMETVPDTHVVRKSEREVEHRERFSGNKQAMPRIGPRELRTLEKHFLVTERAGTRNTRGASATTPDERDALQTIARLTHGAICMAHEPTDDGPGIDVHVGSDYARTGRPDTLAFRVQAWLDSPLGANLAQSLQQSNFACRHAVLSFDSSEPEYHSAQEAGIDFVPTAELDLPPSVAVLWCLLDPLLLRYDDAHGWKSFDVVVD